MTTRPGQFRALLAALAAMLAVFVQVMTPAAAMAHDLRESGSAIVICSAEGSKVVILGADGSVRTAPAKGFMGLKCSDCVGPTLAVTVRGHARGPPRPPGQGPPQNLNA